MLDSWDNQIQSLCFQVFLIVVLGTVWPHPVHMNSSVMFIIYHRTPPLQVNSVIDKISTTKPDCLNETIESQMKA